MIVLASAHSCCTQNAPCVWQHECGSSESSCKRSDACRKKTAACLKSIKGPYDSVMDCVCGDGWKSVDTYVENLMKPGEMGGMIEIEAYALMTKQSIFVWSEEEGTGSLRLTFAHNRAAPSRIHLLYSSAKKHYKLLRLCPDEKAMASTESSSGSSRATEAPAAPPDASVRVSSVLVPCVARLSGRPSRMRGIVQM